MSLKKIVLCEDNFLGNRSFSNGTAEAGTGWYASIVKSAGSPTIATATGTNSGQVYLTTDNTSEIQKLTLYHGDVLDLGYGNIVEVVFNFSLSGQTANTTAYIGLAGAHNATASSIAPRAWFKIANSAISCETNNNSTTTSVSTGASLGTGLVQAKISFAYGSNDVRFYLDSSATGSLSRLSSSSVFDTSAYTGSFQPYIRVEKTASTDVPILSVDYFAVEGKML